MKSFFLHLLLVLSIAALLFSCKSSGFSSIAQETENPAEDYFLDCSNLQFWDTSSTDKTPCGSYDESTQRCSLNVKWKAGQIWLGKFDASDYKYLKVEYHNANSSFRIQCTYEDGTDDFQLCEENRTCQYLKLNTAKRNCIKSITLWNTNGTKIEFNLDSMSFTQNYILADPIIDKAKTIFNSQISACNLVKEMGAGWNLANNFEAHGFTTFEDPCQTGLESETLWSEPRVTKEIIELGKKYGYKTIRIPVTWYNHIVDDSYTIDPFWMARIKQAVDWAYEAGYYVILNEHHSVHGDEETTFSENGSFKTRAMHSPLRYGDGYIIRNNKTDITESKKFLTAVWTQIGQAFNNGYDEHLIFETMNEPRNAGHHGKNAINGKDYSHEWAPALLMEYAPGKYWADYRDCSECKKDYEILNEMNQVCLDAIRATGGNNSNRFVMIPGLCTSDDTILEDRFRLPVDTASDKLIATVHNYIFGSGNNPEKNIFSDQMKSELQTKYEKLNEKFVVEKNIPVVVGETGAPHFYDFINDDGVAERNEIPLEERIKWITFFGNLCRDYGMAVCYWDCGGTRNGTMAELDRQNLCPYEPEFVNAFVGAMKQSQE